MASIARLELLLLLSLQLFVCHLLPTTFAHSSGLNDGFTINGRVKIPNFGTRDFGLPAKTSNVKVILNGGQRVTFLRPDGYFSFYNVPAGTHLIEVAAPGYFFSPMVNNLIFETLTIDFSNIIKELVRVDVSARNPGKVQASLTETRRALTELSLEPLREEIYYEKREPFSPMSLLKSPMGLMVGFMVIVVFVMPKLMDNVDPEEMRLAQEQMRGQGVPSLANFLGGAQRS